MYGMHAVMQSRRTAVMMAAAIPCLGAALVRGDCIEHLRRMKPESVDAVVTDPPYGVAWQSKAAGFGKIANDERPYLWWLGEAFRVLKPDGAIACFCGYTVQETWRSAIVAAGFTVRSHVVWDKGGYGKGDLVRAFAPRHEIIWFATKGRFRFHRGRPASVLNVPRVPNVLRTHPTEKPVALMRSLVRALTRQGELVLDPFMGTGSTGVAAMLEGCAFKGIELDGKYVRVARRRVAEARRTGMRRT